MTEEELDELWEKLRDFVEGQVKIAKGDWYREYQADALHERFYLLYNYYQDDK